MLRSILPILRCPDAECVAPLTLHSDEEKAGDVLYGSMTCTECKANYPVLAGVAIMVSDVGGYLFHHVKGISKLVPDNKIPKQYRREYLEAKESLAEQAEEHIEEDLESDRVNSLYLITHYLLADTKGPNANWWKPLASKPDPLIDSLIQKYWNAGPFSVVEKWLKKLPAKNKIIELGCGVGGLSRRIPDSTELFLGVDFSFVSVALARHLNLDAPYDAKIRIPEDLIQGSTSRAIQIAAPSSSVSKKIEFIAADLAEVPVVQNFWDASISLNAIDMLDEPAVLPETQFQLLGKTGAAIQSCPYIWHDRVAKKLRDRLPKGAGNSAQAVRVMYEQVGFKVAEEEEHIPWFFFKHVRQLEFYSVHAFLAKKTD